LLFYLCQIRSHVRILIIIGYYTLLYSYYFNPIKKQPFKTCDRTLFFPYCTTGSRIFFRIGRPIRFFFRIVHYVREVTRWFLSSASKLFLIVIYNQINLFDI
jgi:hypothetical protein